MHSLTRALLVAVAAPLLALAVPIAAAAAPAPYAPGKPDTWSRTITPSTVVTHRVPSGVFEPSATVDLTVTAECAPPALAVVSASRLDGRIVSDASGGAVVKLDFGATTCGVYDVTAAEPGSERVSYGVVTVVTADPASASASLLARTGTVIDIGVLGAAAAALIGGAVLLLVARSRRRGRVRPQG